VIFVDFSSVWFLLSINMHVSDICKEDVERGKGER
jgi:hypothetical protein